MLRTIYARFKESGFIKWLVYSCCGGEETVTNALNSGDVKNGILFHKSMFEATLYREIELLDSSQSIVQMDVLRKIVSILRGDVKQEPFLKLQMQIQLLSIFHQRMAEILELYFDMVNLLHNIVFFNALVLEMDILTVLKNFVLSTLHSNGIIMPDMCPTILFISQTYSSLIQNCTAT